MEKKKLQSISIVALIVSILPLATLIPSFLHLSLSNEIQTVVTSAVESCDAIYIPTDNTMASNTQIVNNVCMPAKVPVIAGEQGICSGCGIATLSISYYDIGYTAGEMAYQVLAEGEDISTMEIQTAPEVTKMYNPTICEELGITVPDDYEAIETE